MIAADDETPPPFYHGTRAALQPGDLIARGYSSNYGRRKQGILGLPDRHPRRGDLGRRARRGRRARPDLRRRADRGDRGRS